MSSSRTVLSVAALVLCAALGLAETNTAWKCSEVIDGDTIRVESDDGTLMVVHLFGVDAPELEQARGVEARDFVAHIATGKQIDLELKNKPGQASVAIVRVENVDIAVELAEAGLAWLAQDGATSDEYVVAIFSARAQKASLWSDEEPMHPAEWREENLKPAPTPTPRHELADLAATTSLTGENGEPIVISDIPSIYARNRKRCSSGKPWFKSQWRQP